METVVNGTVTVGNGTGTERNGNGAGTKNYSMLGTNFGRNLEKKIIRKKK